MAVTRDQARRLLSESEMTLFSESRNPALRALTAAGLARRVERTRKLRDKSRDLFQRQRLGSRQRTGSKAGISGADNARTQRKGEVLEDILQRFEGRLQEVQQAGGQASTREASSARKSATKTVAGKKAPRRAAASPAPKAHKKAGSKAAASGPSRARKTAAGTPAKGKSAKGTVATTARRPRKPVITPERALAQTRDLLEAKQQRDRQPPAYRMLDAHAEPGQPDPGYQSGSAKDKAQELHAGEVRLEPIHGSVSTRGRQSQGKRDHR